MPAADQPAIILAAGRGSRMGGPKAIMPVAGRPWWQWQRDRLAGAGIPAIWVVSPLVRGAMLQSGLILVESSQDAPMFESLRAGLDFIDASAPGGVFVLPVDVPAPSAAVWRALPGAGDVAAPAHAGAHGHPIWLAWPMAQREVLQAPEGSRLDQIIHGRVVHVEVNDPSVTTNLNTPEDVRNWSSTVGAAG